MPHKLIMALLNCGYQEAKNITERYGPTPKPSEMMQTIDELMRRKAEKTDNPHWIGESLPHNFRSLLGDERTAAKRYISYLVNERGFQEEQIDDLSFLYDLHYAIDGPWKERILIPIYDMNFQLQTWTGRALNSEARIRYKTLSPNEKKLEDQEGILARAPITDFLGNEDVAKHAIETGKDILIVMEGPFDMMKIGVEGLDHGIFATCIFTTNVSEKQQRKLVQLPFKHKFLLLDAQEELKQTALQLGKLPGFKSAPKLPNGVEDPGDLTFQQTKQYCEELRRICQTKTTT